jgi:hypothetical protein
MYDRVIGEQAAADRRSSRLAEAEAHRSAGAGTQPRRGGFRVRVGTTLIGLGLRMLGDVAEAR